MLSHIRDPNYSGGSPVEVCFADQRHVMALSPHLWVPALIISPLYTHYCHNTLELTPTFTVVWLFYWGHFSLLFIMLLNYFFFFLFSFYCCSITVVPIPTPPTLVSFALPTPVPTANLRPVVCVHGSFIQFPWLDPSPSFPHYLLPLPPGPCLYVIYFHVSGSVLLVYLFCWLVSSHLQERSCGIFLLPPGLFHLA